MRDPARGFLEHQAVVRRHGIGAAGSQVVGQGSRIKNGIIATEAELEAVLALSGSVTGALVTAKP